MRSILSMVLSCSSVLGTTMLSAAPGILQNLFGRLGSTSKERWYSPGQHSAVHCSAGELLTIHIDQGVPAVAELAPVPARQPGERDLSYQLPHTPQQHSQLSEA